jgi:uncharacterized protein YutE (UPF0331/DUF86 family)
LLIIQNFVQFSAIEEGTTMYIDDSLREKVGAILDVLSERAGWLSELASREDAWWETVETRWAAERALHVAIECTTDAANDIIDAVIMRDPGSYIDIVRVLMEEHVVEQHWFKRFEQMLPIRDKLIRKHTDLSPEQVRDAVREYASLFQPYVAAVRSYLNVA